MISTETHRSDQAAGVYIMCRRIPIPLSSSHLFSLSWRMWHGNREAARIWWVWIAFIIPLTTTGLSFTQHLEMYVGNPHVIDRLIERVRYVLECSTSDSIAIRYKRFHRVRRCQPACLCCRLIRIRAEAGFTHLTSHQTDHSLLKTWVKDDLRTQRENERVRM